MSYFYGALGVAMLAGVMAIFEMGLSLTGQSLMPNPTDPYFSESYAQNDKILLNALNNVTLFDYGWCDTLARDAGNVWIVIDQSSEDFCVLSRSDHQVVVRACRPGSSGEEPYSQYYSCIVDPKEGACNFVFEGGC